MASTYERLEKIVSACVPQKVTFTAKTEGQSLFLAATVTRPRSDIKIEDDCALQNILQHNITEYWDHQRGKYTIDTSVSALWVYIKQCICGQYDEISTRCAATKRKTAQFINSIKIDDKHLSNFLLQVFVDAHSDTFKAKSDAEQEALFEQFEPLRRTYGKRS